MAEQPQTICELTVVIPAINEAENLRLLLPSLWRVLGALGISAEVLVIGRSAPDESLAVARDLGARPIVQTLPGYGGALRQAFREARGAYLLTMDADLSHEPNFVAKLWANRDRAEVIIASRYVRGGVAYMPLFRKLLSRVLNRTFTRGLALDVFDISSGFRLYHADVLKDLPLRGIDFDVLPEIVLRAHIAGWRVAEVPFTYFPRAKGSSSARILRVGWHLAKTFARLWRLRNSIEAADYDERAFYSLVPPQRLWQRKRHEIIAAFARGVGGRILDVGCGSSVILQSLNHAIGLDIRHTKMRYMRRYGLPVVTGSIFALPFADCSMEGVVCSEVIEHVPSDPSIFTELDRVLKPGGLLILGTPDYGTWTWPAIEWCYHRLMPGGYADEHIAHYTRASLQEMLRRMGYEALDARYVYRGELIVLARKGTTRPIEPETLRPLLPQTQARDAGPRRPTVCMLATKFYATSDMGGGLERSARRLFQELLARGWRVVVLTRNYDGLQAREVIDGVEVIRLPLWGRSRVMASLSYLLQALGWLWAHRRDYQLIHCHQSYAPATIGGLARWLWGAPVVVKISTADEFSERRMLERLPFFRMRRFLLRRVDRFVTVNRHAHAEFAQLGIAPDRIAHIPNGVAIPSAAAYEPSARAAARKRLGLVWGRIVLYVGRLSAEKNLPVLIAAWPQVVQRHPEAHLLFVGDGGTFRNVEPSLRAQVTRLHLQESVHFMGRVAETLDFFLAADCFVLPSSTEGMSNALLEAMAAGLPIVATRIPGNCAVITEGEHGLLVEPCDAQALSRAIITLLTSPEVADRLAQAARRRAEEQFALPRVGEAYGALYTELLTQVTGPP